MLATIVITILWETNAINACHAFMEMLHHLKVAKHVFAMVMVTIHPDSAMPVQEHASVYIIHTVPTANTVILDIMESQGA